MQNDINQVEHANPWFAKADAINRAFFDSEQFEDLNLHTKREEVALHPTP